MSADDNEMSGCILDVIQICNWIRRTSTTIATVTGNVNDVKNVPFVSSALPVTACDYFLHDDEHASGDDY